MTKFRTLKIFIAVFGIVALGSCENDDSADTIGAASVGTGDVYYVIIRNGGSASLEAALRKASGNLPEKLKEAGPYTFFAPNDAAFQALATATELGFKNDSELFAELDADMLGQILSYHIVAGEFNASDLKAGTKLMSSIEGEEILVTASAKGEVQLLDATDREETNPVSTIMQSNPNTSNGIVHFVDKVLLPAKAVEDLNIDTTASIADWILNSEELSVMTSVLDTTGLTNTIKGLENKIVLAPTNAAFEQLLSDLGDDYNSLADFDNDTEIEFLKDIVKYHVLEVAAEATDLMGGTYETSLKGSSVNVSAENGGFSFVDPTTVGASTTKMNLTVKNGNIYFIDKVLMPQAALDFQRWLKADDLKTTITNTTEFSILNEAFKATNLYASYVDQGNESFVQLKDEKDEAFEKRRAPKTFTYYNAATVFAPTNAAFEELFETLGANYTSIASFTSPKEIAFLKEVLLYHTVKGRINGSKLTESNLATGTESKLRIRQNLGSDDFVINDESNLDNAHFTNTNKVAKNGSILSIDKVLLSKDAFDFVRDTVDKNDE